MAVVGHLCLSTEGIPSLRRGPRPLSPVYPMHPFLCLTGFKLVFFFFFAYCYIFLSLSVYLPPLPSSLPAILLNPFVLFCSPISMHPPQAKQCSELSHHTNGTNVKHTNQLQLTLGSSSEQESMALVPASRKRKAGTLQTNQPTKQRKTPERKNVLCLFTFWYTSHHHLVKLFLSLKI